MKSSPETFCTPCMWPAGCNLENHDFICGKAAKIQQS